MTPPTWHPLGLKTITPAFLGRFPDHTSATQTQIPFPVSSLRGVLAYWLRAVVGPSIGDDTRELLRLESDLFGRPAGTGASRPSRILLRADRITVGPPPKPASQLGYLMGPGLTDDDQPPPRRLWPGRLTIDVRNTRTPQHADLFLCALWALRAFGGIGARSRRGFGTLALNGPPTLPHQHFAPSWLIRDNSGDLDDVLTCAAAALHDLGFRKGDFGTAQPRYPCFAPGRFRITERPINGGHVDEVLARVGNTLRTLRHPEPAPGWTPPPGKPFILPTTEGYRKLAQPYADNQPPQPWPFTDGALGLPIVYTVEHHDEPVTIEPVNDGTPTRRASPLWLRVTLLKGWHLRSLAFHTEWLPQQHTLQIKSANRDPEPVSKPSPDQIKEKIDEWFDRLPEQI